MARLSAADLAYRALTNQIGVTQGDLVIVSKTMLTGILNAVPPEALERFLRDYGGLEDSAFGAWLTSRRNAMKLNKTELAEKVTAKGVPLYQSDVSALEANSKPGKFGYPKKARIKAVVENL